MTMMKIYFDPAKKLETGDIFLDSTGLEFSDGKEFTRYSMFEYREGEEYGKGFVYSVGGISTYYFWAKPEQCILLETIPEDILFSFRHGSNQFKIAIEEKFKAQDAIDLIRRSDFQYVTQAQVDVAQKMEAITTLDDVIENWEFIKREGPPPFSVMILCLEAVSQKVPQCINGELGIQMMQIFGQYRKYFILIDGYMKIIREEKTNS